ncbi:MAG: TonB-dependent receptor [Sphingomonas sp. 28-62-20]|nr:MAG: TonB-dependent receptor [Sphingomonas sp. 28-62-20]
MPKHRSHLARLCAGISSASFLLALASPALAQDAPTAPSQPVEDSSTAPDIVVTGSLITNPNLVRSTPVLFVSRDEIELRQSNVAEEVIRNIPGVVPNVGSAVNNGNNGASYVDLRGLGSNRNIVLLDGVRITPTGTAGSITGLGGRVDLNNIPLALIDRVDALTGAASTTYGADAITGVVNFVTRRDFSGVELAGSSQITERGDGFTYRADATVGGNFADGRGNAVLSVGYQHADAVYQGGPRAYSENAIESLQAEAGGGSPTATPSSFSVPGRGQPQIDASGNLVPAFSTFNFNPFNIFQTPFNRYNIYAAGHYEVSDGIEAYARGLFSKNTVSTIAAASGVFNQSVTIPVSNPFLPAGARATFCANNDFDANTPGVQTLSVAQCNAAAVATSPSDPNYRTFTTNLRRRTLEVGNRTSDYQTTYFDYRLGFRGDLTPTLKWDVWGSYGESELLQTLTGYTSVQRARQSLLATNPTSCLPGTLSTCVPVNFFGPPGSITPAQAAFLNVQSTTNVRTSQAQVHGQLSGDVGFASPAASDPISFAVGGEYRKYTGKQNADLVAQDPGDLGGSGAAILPFQGGFNVYEGFGELVAPLVQDKPFFRSLTLEAGVRQSHYTVDAPSSPNFSTTTYKAGGSWEPVEDLKIRGNYSHAVRAPNIGELFAPQNTSLTNLGNDPCAGVAPLNNANLRAICLAQGAPAFTIGNIANPAAGQPNSTSGGNLNVKPESADTYTLGAVFQPRFVRGLSLSLDYYTIRVSGAITAPTPGDAISACFGSNPSSPPAGAASSAACTSIRRDPGTGGLDGDVATTPGLSLLLSNLGTLKTSGLDLAIDYKTDLGFAKLALNFLGNYTLESKFRATPSSINRECVGFYSVNCSFTGSIQPKFQWSQRTTLDFGGVDLSLLWRHIDAVNLEPLALADQLAAAAGDPANCPDPNGADPGACVFDPQFRHINAADYFDLSTRFKVGEHYTLTFTVQNLLNRQPPVVGNDIGATAFNSGNTYPSTYDALGRRFNVALKLKF